MRSKQCLVCLSVFKSIRKDTEFCGSACRQRASRDRRKGKFVPAWTDYRVIHLFDTFTLHTQVEDYKRRDLIDNTDDDIQTSCCIQNWRDQIRDNMAKSHSVLFICTHKEDMYNVVKEIEMVTAHTN